MVGRLTSDVFLFWRGLFWAGGFLNVNDEFLLCLVLIYWSRWIVNLIIDVKSTLVTPPTTTEPV